ncbi:MAG: alpha-2-macroglobulin family protein [Bacillota bacterium]
MFKPGRKLVVSAAAVSLLAVIVLFSFWPGGSVPTQVAQAAEIELVPTKQGRAGIDPATRFVLSSRNEPLEAAAVKGFLEIIPATQFQVQKLDQEGRQWEIIPAALLEEGKVYRFALAAAGGKTFRWAFQTTTPFRVIGALPRDKSSYVPVNSGIEIIFSHAGVENLPDYFEIKPHAEGRFIQHKKTWVFLPKGLLPATVYTVKIKKGLPLAGTDMSLERDFEFSFETQPVQEPGLSQRYFNIVQKNSQFALNQAPFFLTTYYHNTKEAFQPEVGVQVFQYKSAEQFAGAVSRWGEVPDWASCQKEQYLEDVSVLNKVAEFNTKLQPDRHEALYAVFPEALPAGYYLAQFTMDSTVRQAWFQMTDLATYLAVSKTDTLLWVNDLAAGVPVAGAKVAVTGISAGYSTNPQGIAAFPTPETWRGPEPLFVKVAAPGGQETLAMAHQPYFNRQEEEKEARRHEFWRYLYLDRHLYLPADTVRFWGILAPRRPSVEPLRQATLQLLGSDYGPFGANPPLLEISLPVENNCFTGEVKLPHLQPGWYSLLIKEGETTLLSSGFEVATYQKPAYQLEVSSGQRAVWAGENVNFRVKATFFEGTPVANLPLNYSWFWESGGLSTGPDGTASLKVPTRYQGHSSAFQWMNLFLQSQQPELGEMHANTQLMVFDNDVEVRASARIKDGQAQVKVQVNRVVLDGLNRHGSAAFDYIGAAVPGHRISGKVYLERWLKAETGEYYDFINKTVHKTYRYWHEQQFLQPLETVTDSQGTAICSFSAEPGQSYSIQLSGTDFRGNPWTRTVYVYGREHDEQFEGYRYFHLRPEDQEKRRFQVGEEAAFRLMVNEQPVADRSAGFLFYTLREGIQSFRVQDHGRFAASFRQEDIPNFHIKGVYFDGSTYHEAWETLVPFEPQSKALNIKVTADREVYRPKDTVRLGIQVTDTQGRPVKARVNLNLVDEALYSLRQQHVNLLESLYGSYLPSRLWLTAASHYRVQFGGGAEKGGEGDAVRKDFKDAAFFATLQTDSHGRATASLVVPDNLTSWRLTYQAVTPGMEAGSGTMPVVVKLPFFLDMVINEEYLDGDQPVAVLRAYGDKLSPGQEVSYAAVLEGPGGTKSQFAVKGAAHRESRLQLPALEPGRYTLTVKAAVAGGLTDAVEKALLVRDSFLAGTLTEHLLLKPGIRLAGSAEGLTTLAFSDYLTSQSLQSLTRLKYTWGSRLEQRLARELGGNWLAAYFQEKPQSSDFKPSLYQTPRGGLAILPYSDNDLELSAKMARLLQDKVDALALARYLEGILDDQKSDRSQAITALYGLAALGQPVLNEINLALAQPELTLKEKLYLILALAELGDAERARPLLAAILANAEQIGPYARLKTGKDQEDILEPTALAAVAAIKLQEPAAYPLIKYVEANPSKYILTLAEQLLFWEEALRQKPEQPAAFTYSLHGKTEKKELQPGEVFTLVLTPQQMETLRVLSVEGQVGAVVSFQAPFKADPSMQSPDVRVAREYQVLGRAGQTPKAGDIVVVTLKYSIGDQAPAGLYEINDFLPAGLKAIERPYERGLVDFWQYPTEVYGQKVSFNVTKGQHHVKYYARVINPGQFTADHAVVRHSVSGQVFGLSTRNQVLVK